MARQWRHPCENCGNPDVEYLRMHSELNGYGKHIECNVCGSKKCVEQPEATRIDERSVIDLSKSMGADK